MVEISVIMPFYNAEKYINQAIQSILNQSFSNFELIILDDGSTDSSVSIVKSIIDSRIRLFENEKRGITFQLNFGISQAKADFIARMDADDICEQNRFERQFNFLRIHKDIDILGSNCFIIDENNMIIERRAFPETHEEILHSMPIEQTISHPSIMIKKKVFDVLKYESEFEPVEDHSFLLKSLTKGFKFYNLQEFLFYYRSINFNKLTSKSILQKQISYKIGKDFVENNCSKEKELFGKENYYYKLGLIEYNVGNMQLARENFIKYLNFCNNKIFIICRYIIPSLLGVKIISYLRNKNISIKINYLLKKINIETHKV